MNKNIINIVIPIVVLVCGVLIGVIISQQSFFAENLSFLNKNILSSEEAGEWILDYIDQNILKDSGLTASLTEEPALKNGVYELKLKIGDSEFISYLTKDGELLFPEAIVLKEESTQPEEKVEEKDALPGNFSVSEDEVCLEDDKPIIYFFGSQGCSYCQWEHPVIEAVTSEFSNYISFHNNMDSDEDMDVFNKYSNGGIPTLVFGCKYYRVGAGTQSGEEQETKNLTALICKLTGSQPADVCEQVQDLIQEIN